MARLSPPDLRGRYQGVLGTSFGAALTVAPAVGGVVLGRLGAGAIWVGGAGLCVLVAAGHLVAGRARALSSAAAPAETRAARRGP